MTRLTMFGTTRPTKGIMPTVTTTSAVTMATIERPSTTIAV